MYKEGLGFLIYEIACFPSFIFSQYIDMQLYAELQFNWSILRSQGLEVSHFHYYVREIKILYLEKKL